MLELPIEYRHGGEWHRRIEVDGMDLRTPDGASLLGQDVRLRTRLAPPPDETCNGFTVDDTACQLSAGWGRPDGAEPNPGRCRYHADQPYVDQEPDPDPVGFGVGGFGTGTFGDATAA